MPDWNDTATRPKARAEWVITPRVRKSSNGHQDEHLGHDEHHDPHAWLDPANAETYRRNVEECAEAA